ncbi:MAG: hypothetical protein R3C59_17485 [Planctomycetaceae bacterium]
MAEQQLSDLDSCGAESTCHSGSGQRGGLWHDGLFVDPDFAVVVVFPVTGSSPNRKQRRVTRFMT